MKRIIFSGPDGIASVIIPAYNDEATGKREDETEADYLARVVARNVEAGVLPPATMYAIIDEAELPVRHYRNAWRVDVVAGLASVKHDMVVARQMKLDQEIRPERNRRLAAKDVEFTKALGAKDQAAADAVESTRQQLREIGRAHV